MKRHESIYHRGHGHNREQARRDAPHVVAKVEQANGQAAQDDGEVEVREEGALVGEEDFGFDARRERDAFS